jgi:segregation and condensation protein B
MARLEAALFVAENAQSPKKLAQVAALEDAREALELIEQLNAIYQQSRSAFRIERVATGFRLLARQELATWLDRVHQRQALTKLSPPLLETVTIIAYRQPCTRADVESIRGVQSAEIIKNLMERNLVRVVGEDDSLGRPYLYGTTRQFLETFGLISLADLPHADRLRRQNAPASESTDEADGSRQAA